MKKYSLRNNSKVTRLLASQSGADLKHSHHSLEKELLELRDRNKELNEFVFIVAHELKNPLSSIIGFASLIDQYYDRMGNSNVLETVRSIVEIGQHMNTIINGLLLLAKTEDAIAAEVTPLDMHLILEQVTQSLSNVIREYGAHINLPEDWPAAKGYTPWVEEVWTNYISNAIKYGGSPPVIQIGAEATDNGYVHFWVQDNGRGLSPEEQQRLFRPFARLRKHDVEGSGLGLTVVKKIVERLEGNILLASEVGKGSRFGFTLRMA